MLFSWISLISSITECPVDICRLKLEGILLFLSIWGSQCWTYPNIFHLDCWWATFQLLSSLSSRHPGDTGQIQVHLPGLKWEGKTGLLTVCNIVGPHLSTQSRVTTFSYWLNTLNFLYSSEGAIFPLQKILDVDVPNQMMYVWNINKHLNFNSKLNQKPRHLSPPAPRRLRRIPQTAPPSATRGTWPTAAEAGPESASRGDAIRKRGG